MLYAGIDYHKRYSQVHVIDQGERSDMASIHATICSAKLRKAKDGSGIFADALTGVYATDPHYGTC